MESKLPEPKMTNSYCSSHANLGTNMCGNDAILEVGFPTPLTWVNTTWSSQIDQEFSKFLTYKTASKINVFYTTKFWHTLLHIER